MNMADTLQGKNTPDLIAAATAQKVVNFYGGAARNVAEDLTGDDLDEDAIVAALHRYSDRSVEGIAQEAVNMSYRAGRADELSGFGHMMAAQGEDLTWRRSSALEPSSCDSCVDADGEEIDGPDDDLTDIHEGPPESCLCIPYADLEE
jgi:hypothetical protein